MAIRVPSRTQQKRYGYVQAGGPACPVLQEPENQEVANAISPVLRWGAVDGAVSYNVYLWVAGEDEQGPFSTTNTYYETSGLLRGTTYRWRATAVTEKGESSNCSYGLFGTEQAAIPAGDPSGPKNGYHEFDTPAAVVNWTDDVYTVYDNEAYASLYVERDATNGASSVRYTTANDTAQAGTDYTATDDSVSWADGDGANKEARVPIEALSSVEELATDILYDWTDELDCRNPNNDHIYTSSDGSIVFDDEADMLAYLTDLFGGATPVLTSRNTDGLGGYSSTAAYPFLPIPTNPYVDIYFAYHDRTPTRYVDCRSSVSPIAGFGSNSVAFDEPVMALTGSLSNEGLNHLYVIRPGLVGLGATPPDATDWDVFSTGNDAGGYGLYTIYNKIPTRIEVKRVPVAPDLPGSDLPDWPIDPANFWWDELTDTKYSKEPYSRLDGSYRWLSLYAEASGEVSREPLGPALAVGDPSDTQAFWEAARNAAVSAGDLSSAVNTYSAAGNGGVTTYPRNASYVYYRTYKLPLSFTVSLNNPTNAEIGEPDVATVYILPA